MNIEERIRARIEAILTNDARNYAELERMAPSDEPFTHDPFEEERNLYQRVIANYRRAVNEVNKLFEENVGFLSAFYRIVEAVEDKADFHEICGSILDRLLEDLGPEYGALVLFGEAEGRAGFCVEGIREERKFVRVHSGERLLGSDRFRNTVTALVCESSECVNVADVYREPRFNAVDFPSVVRSLVCLPVRRNGGSIGALLLSHSLPQYFNDNHVRVLKILALTIGHMWLLTGRERSETGLRPAPPAEPPQPDLLSLVILEFEQTDPFGRPIALEREPLRALRGQLRGALAEGESMLFHGVGALLVLLPRTASDALPPRVRALRHLFQQWRAVQTGSLRSTRVSFGWATCDDGDDLFRTLEMASFLMHPDVDTEIGLSAEP
jgi:hypothetical protein